MQNRLLIIENPKGEGVSWMVMGVVGNRSKGGRIDRSNCITPQDMINDTGD
jgi:hypothetical protein